MPTIDFASEALTDSFIAEATELAALAYEEHKQFLPLQWGFAPDFVALRALAQSDALLVFGGRVNGRLRAYLTWMVYKDLENSNALVSQQGAWFVHKDHGIGLGIRLYKYSIQVLKSKGVQAVYTHSMTYGRGARLRRFFESQGGKPQSIQFLTWIGD